MCCLSIYKTNRDNWVITHNRDEQKTRQIRADKVIPNLIGGRRVWMPKDALSNGTWIATDGIMVGALLNGYQKKHTRKERYKASRGCIIPELFSMKGIQQFIDEFDPGGFEPFTLIMIHKNNVIEYGWDEKQTHVTRLDETKPQIFSSSTLYNEDVKLKREYLFNNWLNNKKNENDIWSLHALKGNDHSLYFNVDFNDEISTVAISQIVLGIEPVFYYQSLITNNVKEAVYLVQNDV